MGMRSCGGSEGTWEGNGFGSKGAGNGETWKQLGLTAEKQRAWKKNESIDTAERDLEMDAVENGRMESLV